jgi:hypothetical protein
MVRVAVLLVLGVAACDLVPLGPTGDGTNVDGGVALDAGETAEDAGEQQDASVDAGTADVDAGSTCAWGENPAVAFDCEGDEDWCDPPGDSRTDEGDIVALWSRIDGDDAVLQIRFAAAPFRLVPEETIHISFARAEGPETDGLPIVGGVFEDTVEPGDEFCVQTNVVEILDFDARSSDPRINRYPPRALDSVPNLGVEVDVCTFRIGSTAPVIELRLPCATFCDVAGGLVYSVLVDTGPPADFTWQPGDPEHVTSRGGQSDDSLSLEPYCSAECPTSFAP